MLATMSSSTARKMEILMASKFLYYASKLKERKMRTVRLSYWEMDIYIYIYYIVFKEGEWTKEKLFKCITGRICMEKRSHENGWAQKVLTRFSLLHWIALCTRMVQNSEMAALNNLGASITPHDFMALSTQQLVEPCKGHDS